MTIQTAFRHGIGGNNPPLNELLATSYEEMLAEAYEAIQSADRAPPTIEDDTTLGKFGDLVRIINGICKRAEDARKAEKEPFLTSGREVDGFFANTIDGLTGAKKTLLARQSIYLSKKEAEARARQEAEVKAAREAEEAALREAQRLQDSGNTDEAMISLSVAADAEARSVEAEAKAHAKPADLARTYSTGGSVSTLKKEWTFAVEDMAKVDPAKVWNYVSATEKEKAIRAFVRAGGRDLAGVRIFETAKAMVR